MYFDESIKRAESLQKRLYCEDRMDANLMRDWAHLLQRVIDDMKEANEEFTRLDKEAGSAKG